MADSLQTAIEALRTKYAGTSFPLRLEDAASLGPVEAASTFFIRDTEEVANAVWLTNGVIYDATWFVESRESTLNVLALSDVLAFEVREAPDVVQNTYGTVGGDFLVKVIGQSIGASLYWGASFGEEADALRAFYLEVLKAFVSVKGSA